MNLQLGRHFPSSWPRNHRPAEPPPTPQKKGSVVDENYEPRWSSEPILKEVLDLRNKTWHLDYDGISGDRGQLPLQHPSRKGRARWEVALILCATTSLTKPATFSLSPFTELKRVVNGPSKADVSFSGSTRGVPLNFLTYGVDWVLLLCEEMGGVESTQHRPTQFQREARSVGHWWQCLV